MKKFFFLFYLAMFSIASFSQQISKSTKYQCVTLNPGEKILAEQKFISACFLTRY